MGFGNIDKMTLDFESFKKIESNNIETGPINLGETRIILQRHQKFDRDKDSLTAGHLTEDGITNNEQESKKRVESIIKQTPKNERDRLYFFVVASDTVYADKGARSLETAEILINELEKKLDEYGISRDNLLNNSNKYRESKKGEPRLAKGLREPKIFEESPEFVDYLKNKHPELLDFWVAFEEDKYVEKRMELGAEGPEDMADRINKYLKVLKRYSSFFHKSHPESRLIICATSHYDTISPWVKKYVLSEDVTKKYLQVDYGAGLSIDIDKKGKDKTYLTGQEIEIVLEKKK